MAQVQLVYINRSAGNGTASAPSTMYEVQPLNEGEISPPADSRFRNCLVVPTSEDVNVVIGNNPDINDVDQLIFVPAGGHYEVAVTVGVRFAIKGLGTNVNGGGSGGGGGGTAETVKIDPTGNTVKVDPTNPVPISIQSVAGGELDVAITAPVDVVGPLTNTQLRASAVPVSGPLTDTQLRATAVPVSGPLTDTQLRATAVPVSGPATSAQLTTALTANRTLQVGTNRSGSITTGGASQTVAALNANRGHLIIQNISDEDLWMSEFGPAEIDSPGSYRIAPGLAARVLTRNAVTIIGATTGSKFTSTESNA